MVLSVFTGLTYQVERELGVNAISWLYRIRFKTGGDSQSPPAKQTRLIRDPELEEFCPNRVNLHSIADNIGRKHPMPRVFFRFI